MPSTTATTKRIQTINCGVPTEVGTAARIYGAFKESNIDVISSWCYDMGDEGQCHFYVKDLDKTKTTLTKMGFKPTVGNACWVEGDNKVGLYAEVLGKCAKAGVNITATDAFAVGTHFAAVLFCEESDYAKLCKCLNC